uniref:ATP phosphoribosyltransferase n=1 Tax=Vaginimicrobium propionicum TaxID=1871034 RepID=UPI0009705974|nr:ATP phosphoribosyltransferase [Vaginimicrobium propionicum]
MSDRVLKIAVPNKGALAESAARLFREAGYPQRADAKELVRRDPENGVDFYYLRPRDIAVYVGEGTLDLGITGRDMLIDSGAEASEIMQLGFGRSRFHFAAPNQNWTLEDLQNKRIATSYPGLLGKYLDKQSVTARLIHLDGAVESSIQLGVADAIADVVETGTTLRKAGLHIFGDPILESEAVLIARDENRRDGDAVYDHLLQRISGVLVARDYALLDYDIPDDLLEAATRLTPGLEAPTVSPLSKPGWVAVRSMVPSKSAQRLMDDLYDLGARAILVTDLRACRL